MSQTYSGWKKIKQAGFDELYSTAPDAIEKKLKLLDKKD